jgi:2-polyprenyl-6-methoxyphenol hydroxylase-like FAD-dependent oxidoreductase
MSGRRCITVVGGGLAGLTLGIGLRQRGVPVVVREAGRYPRHRVCGEFISGRGQGVLERLGLREAFYRAGAIEARTVAFFLGASRSPERLLTPPALCLSRYRMDALLAEHFRRAGGELHEGERCEAGGIDEGVVMACGRRAQAEGGGWRWFGLKVHARNVSPSADLEMHGGQHGYVGVSRVEGGEINVCGLFRRKAGTHEPAQPWTEALRGPSGSALRERMADAVFDEASFCSVAGLSLRPKRAARRSECCIGDALTMIPPVTGNGMSMAFESAAAAIEPLVAWSQGQVSWREAQQRVAHACDAAFSRRLAWARWLQWMMFAPSLREGLGGVVLRSEWLWRTMFLRTR